MANKDENMWKKAKNKAQKVKEMGEKGGKATGDMWNEIKKKSPKDKTREENK